MIFSLLPLGLPGGDQVDGSPPAASTDLFANFDEFFLKKLIFSDIKSHK